MICAELAGIEVFVTGGIGGVHRGAETSFDISADLQELAQTAVTVVAAGAKAILDLPKTWEVLETLGVPVIAYGQDELPAFWSRASGLKAPLRMDSPEEIAAAAAMRAALGLKGGQLVANPIPVEAEIPQDQIMPVIEQALSEAAAQGIAAKAVTPFLLSRIFELTQGRSLKATSNWVLNNARLAARIAAAMAQDHALRRNRAARSKLSACSAVRMVDRNVGGLLAAAFIAASRPGRGISLTAPTGRSSVCRRRSGGSARSSSRRRPSCPARTGA